MPRPLGSRNKPKTLYLVRVYALTGNGRDYVVSAPNGFDASVSVLASRFNGGHVYTTVIRLGVSPSSYGTKILCKL
jgi:hypothetical protein